MILEGVVTTIDLQGHVNISPMGPLVSADRSRLTLRPFTTSQTYKNLKAQREGVLHVTDDVELIARAAVGEVAAELRPARVVRGFVLADACRTCEFRVLALDDRQERAVIEAEVVHVTHGRDWFGLNRAKHAVVEAAILATRLHLLPREEVERQFGALRPLVDKTGGEAERRAFEFLLAHAAACWRRAGTTASAATTAVRVVTGSRLHFGLIAPWGDGERRFGGAGLMVDRPAIDLTVQAGAEWQAEGPLAARALAVARRLAAGDSPAARIEVHAAPAEHTGLGVGTQLSLAVARAVTALRGEQPPAVELAQRTGRGSRSAIGVHGFEQGGFLVDGGKRPATPGVAPLLLRAEVPASWRLVLATPRHGVGRHGEAEMASFREVRESGASLSCGLAHRLVLGLAPALLEGDARAFGEALRDYNRLAGELFAGTQGSAYASPAVARLVELLAAAGVIGVAQSSWGPTVAALAEDEDRGRWIAALLCRETPASELEVLLAAPLNRGARVEKGLPSAATAGTIVAP